MTIGISGNTATGSVAAPAESADYVATGTIPENGLAILNQSGTVDRVRSDAVMGRLSTSSQDPLQLILQLMRAQMIQNIEAWGLNAQVDDYIDAAGLDHPLN